MGCLKLNTLTGFRRMRTLLRALLDNTHSALTTALGNLREAMVETGAAVTYDALPRVAIPEPQIIQLFQNLIGNAIRYRSELPPHISVSERLHAEPDSGTGMSLAICDVSGLWSVGEDGFGWKPRLARAPHFHFTLPAADQEVDVVSAARSVGGGFGDLFQGEFGDSGTATITCHGLMAVTMRP
jgi:hypothetical protein